MGYSLWITKSQTRVSTHTHTHTHTHFEGNVVRVRISNRKHIYQLPLLVQAFVTDSPSWVCRQLTVNLTLRKQRTASWP